MGIEGKPSPGRGWFLREEWVILALTACFTAGVLWYSQVRTAPSLVLENLEVETQHHVDEVAPPIVPLNLNTATQSELEDLPGIGPVLAQRILDYRDTHGGFTSVDELLNIEGIGEGRLEDLRLYTLVS